MHPVCVHAGVGANLSKWLLTLKLLHLEYFVEICYLATFFLSTR